MPNEKRKKLYNYLSSEGMTDLSYDKFSSEYSTNKEKQNKLYSYLSSEGMTDLDESSFSKDYFESEEVDSMGKPEGSQEPLEQSEGTTTTSSSETPSFTSKSPYDIRSNDVVIDESGEPSTVKMATETFDGKNWHSFPTLFPKDPNNQTNNPDDWISYDDPKEAYAEAKKRGEVWDFNEDKEGAIAFGEGSWKKPTQEQSGEGEKGGLESSNPITLFRNSIKSDINTLNVNASKISELEKILQDDKKTIGNAPDLINNEEFVKNYNKNLEELNLLFNENKSIAQKLEGDYIQRGYDRLRSNIPALKDLTFTTKEDFNNIQSEIDRLNNQIELDQSSTEPDILTLNPSSLSVNLPYIEGLERIKSEKRNLENSILELKKENEDILAFQEGYQYFKNGEEVTRSTMFSFLGSNEYEDLINKDLDKAKEIVQIKNDIPLQMLLHSQELAGETGEYERTLNSAKAGFFDVFKKAPMSATASLINNFIDAEDTPKALEIIFGTSETSPTVAIAKKAYNDAEKQSKETGQDVDDLFTINYDTELKKISDDIRGQQLYKSQDIIDLYDEGDYAGFINGAAKLSVESSSYLTAAMIPLYGTGIIANSVAINSYYDLRRDGVSPEKAKVAAGLNSLVAVADNFIFRGMVSNTLKDASAVVNNAKKVRNITIANEVKLQLGKTAINNLIKEPSTEFIQGSTESIINQWAKGEPINYDLALRQGAIEASAAAPTTAVFSATPGVQYLALKNKDFVKIQSINKQIEELLSIDGESVLDENRNQQLKLLVDDYINIFETTETLATKSTKKEGAFLASLTAQEAILEKMINGRDVSDSQKKLLESRLKSISDGKNTMLDLIDKRPISEEEAFVTDDQVVVFDGEIPVELKDVDSQSTRNVLKNGKLVERKVFLGKDLIKAGIAKKLEVKNETATETTEQPTADMQEGKRDSEEVQQEEIEVFRGTAMGNKSDNDGLSYVTTNRNYASFYESGSEKPNNTALTELSELKEPTKPIFNKINREDDLASAQMLGYDFKSVQEMDERVKELNELLKNTDNLSESARNKARNELTDLAEIGETEADFSERLREYNKELSEYKSKKKELEDKSLDYLSPRRLSGNSKSLNIDFEKDSPKDIFSKLKELGISKEFKGGNFLDNYHSDLIEYAKKNNIDYYNGIIGGVAGSMNVRADEIIVVNQKSLKKDTKAPKQETKQGGEEVQQEDNEVKTFAKRIANGEDVTAKEDAQFYENNKAEVEAELKAIQDLESKPEEVINEVEINDAPLTEDELQALSKNQDAAAEVEAIDESIKSTKDKLAELDAIDFETLDTAPDRIILENIGKVDTESAKAETGGKIGNNMDVPTSWVKKGEPSIEAKAEQIYDEFFSESKPPEYVQEIRSKIIDFIQGSKKEQLEQYTKLDERKNLRRELREFNRSKRELLNNVVATIESETEGLSQEDVTKQGVEELVGSYKNKIKDIRTQMKSAIKGAKDNARERAKAIRSAQKTIDDFVKETIPRGSKIPKGLARRIANVRTDKAAENTIEYIEGYLDRKYISESKKVLKDKINKVNKKLNKTSEYTNKERLISNFILSLDLDNINDLELISKLDKVLTDLANKPIANVREADIKPLIQDDVAPPTPKKVEAESVSSKIDRGLDDKLTIKQRSMALNKAKNDIDALVDSGEDVSKLENDLLSAIEKLNVDTKEEIVELNRGSKELLKMADKSDLSPAQKAVLDELNSVKPREDYLSAKRLNDIAIELSFGYAPIKAMQKYITDAYSESTSNEIAAKIEKAQKGRRTKFQDIMSNTYLNYVIPDFFKKKGIDSKSLKEVNRLLAFGDISRWDNFFALGKDKPIQKGIISIIEKGITAMNEFTRNRFDSLHKMGRIGDSEGRRIVMAMTQGYWDSYRDGSDYWGELIADENFKNENRTRWELIKKEYESMPKKDGKVDYESFLKSDLSKNGKKVYNWIIENNELTSDMQMVANQSRGQKYEGIDNRYYIPMKRLGDLSTMMDEDTYVDNLFKMIESNSPKLKSDSSDLRKSNKIQDLNLDLYSLIADQIYQTSRDYHLTEGVKTSVKTLGKLSQRVNDLDAKKYLKAMRAEFKNRLAEEFSNKSGGGLGLFNIPVKFLYQYVLMGTRLAPEFAAETVRMAGAAQHGYLKDAMMLRGLDKSNLGLYNNNINRILEFSNSPFVSNIYLETIEAVSKSKLKRSSITEKMGELNQKILSLPDSATFNIVWSPAFLEAFNKENGSKFDIKAYKANPDKYLSDNKDAVNKAASFADAQTQAVKGAKTKFARRRMVKMLPDWAVKVPEKIASKRTGKDIKYGAVSATSPMGRLVTTLQNFAYIEQFNLADNANETIYGENKGRPKAATEAAMAILSGSLYTWGTSYLYALTSMSDDEAEEEIIRLSSLEGIWDSIVSNAMFLMSGRYGNIGKTAVLLSIGMYDTVLKRNLSKSEYRKKSEELKEWTRGRYYAEPIQLGGYKSDGDVINAFVPFVSRFISLSGGAMKGTIEGTVDIYEGEADFQSSLRLVSDVSKLYLMSRGVPIPFQKEADKLLRKNKENNKSKSKSSSSSESEPREKLKAPLRGGDE